VITNGVEIGGMAAHQSRPGRAGWHRVSARRLYANLGCAAGQDDDNVFAVIWNPAD
jgi:hypothetical protein